MFFYSRLLAKAESTLLRNTLCYFALFGVQLLLVEITEELCNFFEGISLPLNFTAIIQNLTVFKFMIVLEKDKEYIGGKLLLRYKIAFVLVFTVILVYPSIGLKECIVGNHLGADLERSELLVEEREAGEYLRDVL
jgi:hypothetical protein